MAGIIKGQLLKQLSKFTKNLSPDQIHLSTLRGEGELNNLELDEQVLMEVLELPTWLRITSATCNRVAMKIQWTKLKSQPMCLYLDEVNIDVSTCEKPREPIVSALSASLAQGGKYGFAERIIDGMYLSINGVNVNFTSHAFKASIQISRIQVQSKTPLWKNGDLRLTRIKDELRGEILLFKEAEWYTLRIEANALDHLESTVRTTPLRLISNQSKIRITMKKRLSDCGVIASKVQFNLDDLLWVLTSSQLKAAILFVQSLKDVVRQSAQQSKRFAGEKLKKQGQSLQHGYKSQQNQGSQHSRQGNRTQMAMSKLFNHHNIIETSYHFYSGRIDLHFCEEQIPGQKIKVEGGAMQLTIYHLGVDSYPFHPVKLSKSHWTHKDENVAAQEAWTKQLTKAFVQKLQAIHDKYENPPVTNNAVLYVAYCLGQLLADQGQGQGEGHPGPIKVKGQVVDKSIQMLEGCLLVRVEDFALFQVSTANSKGKAAPKLLSSDKKQLLLPPEMSAIHLQYTDYFFPDGIELPVPSANVYAMVNPVKVTLDYTSLAWMNHFMLNLAQSMDFTDFSDEPPALHRDIKIEALMPRVLCSAMPPSEICNHQDRPETLQIQVSRLTATNTSEEPKCSQEQLQAALQPYQTNKLFNSKVFPRKDTDFNTVPPQFIEFANDDCVKGQGDSKSPSEKQSKMKPVCPKDFTMHPEASTDIWCLMMDQFWIEFTGVPSSKSRPVPFTESFPLTLWVCTPQVTNPPISENHVDCDNQTKPKEEPPSGINGEHEVDTNEAENICDVTNPPNENTPHDGVGQPNELANTHVLLKVGSKVSAQLNRQQFLFLMRLIENVTDLMKEIEADTAELLGETNTVQTMMMAVVLQEAEVALLLPAPPQQIKGPDSLYREDSSVSSPNSESIPDFSDPVSPVREDIIPGQMEPVVLSDSDTSNSDLVLQPPGGATISIVKEDVDLSRTSLSSIPGGSANSLSSPGNLLLDDVSDSSGLDVKQVASDMRKSITGVFSKGLEKIKQNKSKRDLLDVSDDSGLVPDDFDTMSIRSGASSDDEEFVVLGLAGPELPAFDKHHAMSDSTSVTEESCEGKDMNLDSSSISTDTNRLMVCPVIFRLVNICAMVQTAGKDMSSAVTVDHVVPQEYPYTSLDRFQGIITSGVKNYTEGLTPPDVPVVQLRFSAGPDAKQLSPAAEEVGFLALKAHQVELQLLMTTVLNMVDLVEDEKLGPPLPMKIEVTDAKITLQNDKPKPHPVLYDPPPIILNVSGLTVIRTDDGAFHLSGDASPLLPCLKEMESKFNMKQIKQMVTHDGSCQTMSCDHVSHEPLLSDYEKNLQAKEIEKERRHYEQKIFDMRNTLTSKENEFRDKMESLNSENKQLRDQVTKLATLHAQKPENQARAGLNGTSPGENGTSLPTDQQQLLEQVAMQADEIKHLQGERDSLLATLQLMQQELSYSENRRTHSVDHH